MTLECPGCHARYDVGGRPAGTQARCRCGTSITVPAASEVASALTCPQCGASVSPDDACCAYCRAPLALAACPRCFGRVFRGNPFCPHCGAHIDEPAHGTPEGASRRLCPRCQPTEVHLTAHLVEETLLDECHQCGGLWIDVHAFERVLGDRDKQSSLLNVGIGGSVEPKPAPTSLPPMRYLPCPDCRVLMNRKNFAERSGVIIEVCSSHGLWFDRDQLSAVLRFAMSGGIEESKRRQVEELDRRLERRHSPAAGMAASPLEMGPLGSLADAPHWNAAGEIADLLVGAFRHLFS